MGCEGVWGIGGIADCSHRVYTILGASIQLHAPAALSPEKDVPVPTEGESGWTPIGGGVWTFRKRVYCSC